ncbi:MAG: flagellar hook-length control protein FliK [Bacillota bacterium]
MQAIMNATAGSVLDLVRSPGSVSGQDKGGKRFQDYLTFQNSNREKYGKSPVERQRYSYARDKKEPVSPHEPEHEIEPEEENKKVSSDGARMISLLLQGQAFQTESNSPVVGKGSGETPLMEAFRSSLAETGIKGSIANAAAGGERGLNLLTEPEADLSRDLAAQFHPRDDNGIPSKLQNPFLLEGEGDTPGVSGKDGCRGMSFRFQGKAHLEGAPGSSGENALKNALQDAKPAQHVHQERASQVLAENAGTFNSSKLIERAAAGSSGGETDPGLGQPGSTPQMGMQSASVKGLPAQNQDAFIGRLAQVLEDQMLAKSELLMRDGRVEIKLELKPEYLGRLFVRLSLENGAVNARFVVENHQVRNLIENNMTQLKQCLSEQGISWQEASVDVGGSGSGQAYEDGSFFSGDWRKQGGSDTRKVMEPDFSPGAEVQYRESLISFLA